MRSVIVIPARGGSKRIPRKNIREFHGKPMIAWSIENARAIDEEIRVVVSTDDEEIAEIARGFGAEIPFVRPAELSDDYATTVDLMAHAVSVLVEEEDTEVPVCCLYATAPFSGPDLIGKGLETLYETDCDYVVPVVEYGYPIQRALRETDGRLSMREPEHMATRSQDLEPCYHDAGQFYWARAKVWRSKAPIFGNAAPILMPSNQSVDIDTPEDWEMAERLFASRGATK